MFFEFFMEENFESIKDNSSNQEEAVEAKSEEPEVNQVKDVAV